MRIDFDFPLALDFPWRFIASAQMMQGIGGRNARARGMHLATRLKTGRTIHSHKLPARKGNAT